MSRLYKRRIIPEGGYSGIKLAICEGNYGNQSSTGN
ncbi:hypothetical protein CAL7102_04670 [Dulcicalothrix desertica PCC 7102]|nr:hypothetical protein CAL7102_04670 [Dulcicalothrix desertica PCC 7102]